MTNLLEQAGAQPQKQPKYAPLFIDRSFTGIFTQRSVLHDPSDIATARYYGGRPDALWLGSLNIELTNNLTLKRRPGLSPFSDAIYPTEPLRAFSFELTDDTIRVVVDTGSTGNLVVSSVANSVAGDAVYTGVFPFGGNNAYVGMIFQITNFVTNINNNGTFTCVASSTTSITLDNSQAISETAAATAVSAGAVYWDQQTGGLKTLLFGKSVGAGQSYFIAVAGILYIGDGVDLREYTPLNPNGTIWNWGIAAPTNPPGIVITESGASATPWVANTWYSTMGVIIDSNGNAQQLVSVNADGTNPSSNYGLSGNGQPVWNQMTGGTTTDGSVTWQNFGQISEWVANTLYQPGQPIYDPVTNAIFIMSRTLAQSSGPTKPNFIGTPAVSPNAGVRTWEHSPGTAKWMCLGVVGQPTTSMIGLWMPSTHFNELFNPGTGTTPSNGYPGFFNSAVVEPTLTMPPSAQPQYLQAANPPGGTTAASYSHPNWQTAAGETTQDGQLSWLCLGSSTWAALTPYAQWTAKGSVFSVVKDSNNNLQVCIVGGSSGAIEPTSGGGEGNSWGTTYGAQTKDGTVTWMCVGPTTQWPGASVSCFLSPSGFQPPESSAPFGSSSVIGSNFVQFAVQTGISGATQPVWSTTISHQTNDNSVIWQTVAPFTAQSLSWTEGYTYAYSYVARPTTDFFNTNTPPGGTTPLGVPTGSQTDNISTASPVAVITGPNAGAINTISGIGSTDPQVDTIIIWRSADGGGSANMFFLTEILNPPPINGVAQPWSFNDYLPDVTTSTLPGLNNLISAPIDDTNDPPPTGFLPMVYNFERIWGALGDKVVFSGGPDVVTGNPNVAFNPSDEFPYLANVTRVVKTPQGLVIMLTDSIEIIAGGPLTASFYPLTLAPGIGMLDYNALDIYGGEITFFSSDSQLKVISPSLNLTNAGFPLGDQFAAWDSSSIYVAVQQSGIDNCFMVADGSTGWYRCNPHQTPGGAQGPEPVWSPFAAITGGCHMVQSVEVQAGIKRLLVGATTGGQKILQRDLSVYTDNGTQYDAKFVMGAITLAHPGQLALLKFLQFDFSGVNFQPQISYLLNEISGTFVNMPLQPVFDPPSLYGTTITPGSYSPNRYYFSATGSLARCRFLQIQVDFGKTPNPDELFDMTIFGRVFVEF